MNLDMVDEIVAIMDRCVADDTRRRDRRDRRRQGLLRRRHARPPGRFDRAPTQGRPSAPSTTGSSCSPTARSRRSRPSTARRRRRHEPRARRATCGSRRPTRSSSRGSSTSACIPGGGHTWMLQRIVGPQVARAMVLFGQEYSGEDAVRSDSHTSARRPTTCFRGARDGRPRRVGTPRTVAAHEGDHEPHVRRRHRPPRPSPSNSRSRPGRSSNPTSRSASPAPEEVVAGA